MRQTFIVMHYDPLPWINAGANILGNIWNFMNQGRANRQARQYATDMYERQRQDAIEDFQRQWSLETQYNSPQAMMGRYKAAGLNPNLIYGSNQIYNPPSVRSSQAEAWKPNAPQLGTIGLGEIYDLKQREAQTDNLKANTEIANQEAKLKGIQGQNMIADLQLKIADLRRKGVDTSAAELELKKAQELYTTGIEAAKLGVRKQEADIYRTEQETISNQLRTKIELDRNEREKVMQNMNLRTGEAGLKTAQMGLAKSYEEIMNSRIQRAKTSGEMMQMGLHMKQMLQEIESKDFDLRLQKMGIKGNYGDVIRIIGMLISSKDIGEFWKKMAQGGKQGPTPMDK